MQFLPARPVQSADRCSHHGYSDFAPQVGYHSGREIGMMKRRRCHSCCLRSALLPRREGGVKRSTLRARWNFAGIHIPSRFGKMAQCTALAVATQTILFGTALRRSIPADPRLSRTTSRICTRSQVAAFALASVSPNGRRITALGVTPGKPVSDVRSFVEKIRSYDGIGALPPIVLAAPRKKMSGWGRCGSNGRYGCALSKPTLPFRLSERD